MLCSPMAIQLLKNRRTLLRCHCPLLARSYYSSCVSSLDGVEPEASSTLAAEAPKERTKRSSVVFESAWDGYESSTTEILKLYTRKLHDCAERGWLSVGKAIHGRIIRRWECPDHHLWASLLNFYLKRGTIRHARLVFDEMPHKDVVSWTAVISGYVNRGCGDEAIGMFCEMQSRTVMPNVYTYATCLSACGLKLDICFGELLHGAVVKIGLMIDLYIGSALVDVYAKCGDVQLANSVFDSMPERNAIVWSTLLNGYAQLGDANEVWKLFSSMGDLDFKFSRFILSIVLKGCANSRKLMEGQIIHSVVIKTALEFDNIISCGLVDIYSNSGITNDALKVFCSVECPDVITWTAMIACLCKDGWYEEMSRVFQAMRCSGVSPNDFCLCSLLSVAGDVGHLDYGQSVHALLCKSGHQEDITTCNSLVTMYLRNNCLVEGMRIFQAMKYRDSISWTSLLFGFRDCILSNQEQSMIHPMHVAHDLSDAAHVKQLHSLIVKYGFSGNEIVGGALIGIYGKKRCMQEAEVAFRKVINRDLICWTAIITAYAQAGQGENAVNHFVLMLQEGDIPNEYTIASCVNGSGQIGSLVAGQSLHSMAIKAGHVNDWFVAGALVDMYGKCDLIQDAETLFSEQASRDTALWNAMICVHAQHCQVEKVLSDLQLMLGEGVLPDKITFVGVMTACSGIGLVEEGMKLYSCTIDLFRQAGWLDGFENFIHGSKLPHAKICGSALAT
ncbi:hypothetical protein MLD38_014461 [Melastoma candidum]|uniref:Uncharacterized protein n=1 Tax=Melastoma candidum TaxID=119954 RepID=A0ACB9RCZ0_9MYRT|nr:hypothetical protein MLD38_014461 [Melastoma candidum]